MQEPIFTVTIENGHLSVKNLAIPDGKLVNEFDQLVWLSQAFEYNLRELDELIEGHPDWKPVDERD